MHASNDDGPKSAPNPWETPETPDPRPEDGSSVSVDTADPTFDTTLDICKGLWNDHLITLLTAWGTLSIVWLVISMITAFGSLALGLDPQSQQDLLEKISSGQTDPTAIFGMFGAKFWAFFGLTILLGFVQMGIGVASIAPVRRAWVERRNLSMVETLGDLGSRIPKSILLYIVFTVATAIGALFCCVPGLAVGYFMLPSFYLVGGRGDGIFDGVSTGFRWAKESVPMLAILIGVTIAITLAFACVGGVSNQIAMTMGQPGYLVGQLLSWFFGAFFGFFAWIFYMATMLAIDEAEGSRTA